MITLLKAHYLLRTYAKKLQAVIFNRNFVKTQENGCYTPFDFCIITRAAASLHKNLKIPCTSKHILFLFLQNSESCFHYKD